MVGSHRAESTAVTGIITKIPLFSMGQFRVSTEKLIKDWLDLTLLDAALRRRALQNRLVGDASMYKGLLDRESLKVEDGVKYFKDTFRPHLSKECFPLEFFSI